MGNASGGQSQGFTYSGTLQDVHVDVYFIEGVRCYRSVHIRFKLQRQERKLSGPKPPTHFGG